jgi:hypothetical protein
LKSGKSLENQKLIFSRPGNTGSFEFLYFEKSPQKVLKNLYAVNISSLAPVLLMSKSFQGYWHNSVAMKCRVYGRFLALLSYQATCFAINQIKA